MLKASILSGDHQSLARSIFATVPSHNIFDYINNIKNTKVKQTMKKRVQEYLAKADYVDKFERVMEKHFLIVFAGEWSPECQAHIPSLAKLLLASKNDNIVVKIVDYDENRDIAEEMGVLQIPTIIVHDKGWRELGRFVQRPQKFVTVEEELWTILESGTKS